MTKEEIIKRIDVLNQEIINNEEENMFMDLEIHSLYLKLDEFDYDEKTKEKESTS